MGRDVRKNSATNENTKLQLRALEDPLKEFRQADSGQAATDGTPVRRHPANTKGTPKTEVPYCEIQIT